MLDNDREEPSAHGGSSLILALQASAEIILKYIAYIYQNFHYNQPLYSQIFSCP